SRWVKVRSDISAASVMHSSCGRGDSAHDLPPEQGSSAADLAHRAGRADEVDLVDLVPGPLQAHRPGDLAGQRVVARTAAQQRPQVDLVVGEQAGAELAVGGEAHAV